MGAGVDWHENGWGSSDVVDPSTPDFPMPRLTKKYDWYPMSREYSALCLGSGNNKNIRGETVNFNSSFLAGAYNVIHSMLRYGIDTYKTITSKEIDPEAHAREIKAHQERVKEMEIMARDALKGLSEKYPGTVPDYCKDLLKE